jgi:outer membrane immunogenic protein
MVHHMKNISAKLALACLVSVSINLHAEKLPFEGLYGQIGIGYDGASPSATGSSTGNLSTVYGSYNIGKAYNFNESLALGYNYVLDPKIRLGIGFEYHVMIAVPKQDATLTTGNTTAIIGGYVKKNSYDFFIAPGYVVDTDGLAYAKFGLSSSRAELLGDTINFKGYTFGAGYKYALDPNMFVFGEVNYSVYGDQTSYPTTYINGATATHNLNYSYNSKMALIGYGFRF